MAGDRGALVVTGILARRTVRSGLLWGAVFGAVVASSVAQFLTAYSTPEERREIATTIGGNGALRTLFGSGRALETIPGWVAWRSLGIVMIAGSAWGLLAGTRWLRGEEDAGRWDRLAAGPTTRQGATRAAVSAIAAGLVTLWAISAAAIVALDLTTSADFGLRAGLFLAAALVAPAAVAMAVGALAGQLVATRRKATALGAVALAGAYLVAMAGNGVPGLRWALWTTPFGWVGHLHPLTGSPSGPLLALTVFVGALFAGAVWLAGRRDVGAGLRSADDSAAPRFRLLNRPLGLALRMERPVLLACAAGVAAMSFLFGVIASAAADVSSEGLRTALQRLGAGAAGVKAYLGTFFFIVAAVLALIAAGQVAQVRREESDGRLETLLAQPVPRLTWLAGRFAVPAVGLVGLAVLAGVGGWAGAASQHAGVRLGTLVAAGLNAAIPALLTLSIGGLALGVAPRQAVPVTYGLVGSSFLLKLLLVAGPGSRLLLDLSVFSHVALMPAAPFRPAGALVLLGVAVAAAGSGAVAFGRRDLAAGD